VDGGPLTDYDRACNIRDWIAPLKVLNGTGVVFWGDDLGLGLERQSGSLFFAVRIYYEIDNLEDHIGFAKGNPDCFKKDFEILLSSGKVIVFASVFTGVEVREDNAVIRRNCLEIDIAPGLYDVLTYEQKLRTPRSFSIGFNCVRARDSVIPAYQLAAAVRIQDYDLVWEVAKSADISAAPSKRHRNGINSFWLSHGAERYPVIGILVKRDLASVHYIPKDRDAGFVSVAKAHGPRADGTTTFFVRPTEKIWVANHQVVPFSDALKVAQEFAISTKLPKCIEWFEL
jgi:hypothetical protein